MYRDELGRLRDASAHISGGLCLPRAVSFGLFCVDIGAMKDALVARAAELCRGVCAAVAADVRKGHEATDARFAAITAAISKAAETPEELEEQRSRAAPNLGSRPKPWVTPQASPRTSVVCRAPTTTTTTAARGHRCCA